MYTLDFTEAELILIMHLFEMYASLYEQGDKQEQWELNRRVTFQTGIYKDRPAEQTYKLMQDMRKRCEQKLRDKEMFY